MSGFHLVEWHGRATLREPEQPAKRHESLRLFIDRPRVIAEHVIALFARRVLEFEDRLRVEQVRRPLTTP